MADVCGSGVRDDDYLRGEGSRRHELIHVNSTKDVKTGLVITLKRKTAGSDGLYKQFAALRKMDITL